MRGSRTLKKTTIGALALALAGAGMVALASSADAATVYQPVSTINVGRSVGQIAIDPAEHRAYVQDGTDNLLTVLDTNTNTVAGTIPLTSGPSFLAVDTVRHLVYADLTNNAQLAVIDTTTDTVVRTINLPAQSFGVAVDPTTGLVYVPVYLGGENLAVIDPSTDPATISQSGYIESRPWTAVVDPTTHLTYVTTLFGGSVAVMNGTTIQKELYVYGGPAGLAIDPGAHRVYVNRDSAVRVIDTTDNTLLPDNAPSGTTPVITKVDPTTHIGYTSNSENTVTVFDTLTNTTITTVPVSHTPGGGMEIDPTTHTVYISNTDNTITVLKPLTTQSINFTSTAPSAPQINDTYNATATSTSGGAVTFSTASSTCTVTPTGAVTFTHAGDCVIAADQSGDNNTHAAAPTVTQTIPVDKGTQPISVSTSPAANPTVNGSYVPAATAPGGAVTYSTAGTACSYSNGTVHYDHAGTCTVDFDQAGTADLNPAHTSQTIEVLAIGSQLALTTTPATGGVYGQAARASVTVTPAQGAAAGTATFTVDGQQLGSAVTLVNGSADSVALTDAQGRALSAGSHSIGVAFQPTSSDYAPVNTTIAYGVGRASTDVALSVAPTSVSAAVSVVAPGSGTPSGTVEFDVDGQSIGTADVVNGIATLDRAIPAGKTQHVAAIYSGDPAFAGSSKSTSRHDPKITATVVASPARDKQGWYRGSVRVHFTCTSNGVALTTACPKPFAFAHQGAAQSVTRTVRSADGGVATVTVGHVNIDRTAPSVALRGVHNGGNYRGTQRVSCAAGDKLSGVASCVLTQHTTKIAAGRVVTYRAVATDKAGMRRVVSGRYTVLTVWFVGAKFVNGAFQVRPGHTYTLVVTNSTARPMYYWAARAHHRPTRTMTTLHRAGAHRWTLPITMDKRMRSHAFWNTGVKIGHMLHVLKVHVVR